MKVDYISGMNLGYGFNTASLNLHSPAFIDVTSTRDVEGAGGQEVSFKVELTSSTLSLLQQLNVSATASLKYGVSASGSLKTSFLSEFKQNSFSIYVLVQTVVTNKQSLLDLSKVEFKDKAANLILSNPKEFAQQYGDSFIYGLITGGEFLGILEIQSSSASEFREIKAKLSGKGSFGLFSGSASGSFEKALQSITSDYQMKATILRRGSIGAILDSVTPDQLIKEALLFPDKVKDNNGYPYTSLVIPYSHIERPAGPPPFDLSNQLTTLERLGGWRDKFLKYQNDLEFALNHQDQFPGIDAQQISERYNQISTVITEIVNAARSCFTNLNMCNVPPLNLSLLENILPPQNEGIRSSGLPELCVLYNYDSSGGGDTALFVFPAGSSSYQQIWRSGPGNFEWERAKPAAADIRGVGKPELCVLYNYGGGDTALFVFPAGSSSYQQIWRSGPGNFEWERAKLAAADIRGVGKPELCVLYNYGGGDTALFVLPAGSSSYQQIWRSGPGNFEWERAKLAAADIRGTGN